MKSLLFPLAVLGLASAASAPVGAPFTVEETGKGFYRLDDAVRSVNGGDATILIAPGTYRECAVQERGRITFRRGRARQRDLRRRSVRGQGGVGAARARRDGRRPRLPEPARARRQRRRHPHRAWRPDRQQRDVPRSARRASCRPTIPPATIRIDHSTFSGLGQCDRRAVCAHAIYIGHYGKLYDHPLALRDAAPAAIM